MVAGKVIEVKAPLNSYAHAEAARVRARADFVTLAIIFPTNLVDLRTPIPLLVVSVPSGGRSIPYLRNYSNAALSQGWALLAVDGPKVAEQDDTIQFGWGMLSSGVDQFHKMWPQTRQWPIACAGFSGGAKRSAAVAAALLKQNHQVIGVFMGGCNEDRATLGLKLFTPGTRFLQVPMFLSNGTSDPIANPEQGAMVKTSMERSGFQHIRLEAYPDQHRLYEEHVRAALKWFQEKKPSLPAR